MNKAKVEHLWNLPVKSQKGNKPQQLPKNVRENVRELKKHGKNMNSRTPVFSNANVSIPTPKIAWKTGDFST